ncbi:MAG: DUF1178 family protein [Pseudomonadota bacterium]
MIRYALCCENAHDFEAWFRSSADYDTQRARGIVSCPHCGSTEVEKALMAPSVGVKGNRRSTTLSAVVKETPASPVAGPTAASLPAEAQEKIVALAREIREHVTSTSEFVGERFAEEARKIHYEEVEPRGIYGKASPEQAAELKEEGIDVHPLPILPEDRN